MKIKAFNLLAQKEPLAITDKMVVEMQKKMRASQRTINRRALPVLVILSIISSFLFVSLLLFSNDKLKEMFGPTALDDMLVLAITMTMSVAIVAPSVEMLSRRYGRVIDTLQPISEMKGSECADVVDLCQASSNARAFRNAILAEGHPLRLFHLKYMQAMVQKERAQRDAQERSANCRVAHGIPTDTQLTAPPSQRSDHTPLIALGALALAAILFNR